MTKSIRWFALILLTFATASSASAQEHDHATVPDMNGSLHMLMTPMKHASAADSVRAAAVARILKNALAAYADTTAAVHAGYHMFMPQVKEQKVYHFTNKWRALEEAFRFDPARPTSLLYKKNGDGRLVLVGAMYTAPKRFGSDKLDSRVPLSIARWHKHVNWCVPPKRETARWLERRDGHPVFGPESPVVTKEECQAVGGRFQETVFGWMLHANVMESDDPAIVWGDMHAGHDMDASMKTGTPP